jgi:hypothetical protein
MTHRQTLQGFSDTSQASLRKINRINLPTSKQFLPAAEKRQLRSTSSVNALQKAEVLNHVTATHYETFVYSYYNSNMFTRGF